MAECFTPYIVKHNGDEIPVPCNKCPNCVKRRISGWSFRLMEESRKSVTGHFITLTYDTDSVPITRNGFMGLKKRDLQLFFKRLRKAHAQSDNPLNAPIRYYACGEYGGRTNRPHYHIILFNARLELIQEAWSKDVKVQLTGKRGKPIKKWKMEKKYLGNVHYGFIAEASVGYTLKYMCKPGRIPMHNRDDRQPEFALMSKGLGASYLTDNMIEWHKSDINNRMYCNLADGKKIAMPRYFKNKIYDETERLLAGKHQLDKMLLQQAAAIRHYGLERYEQIKQNAKIAAYAKAQFDNQQNRNKV